MTEGYERLDELLDGAVAANRHTGSGTA